MARKSITLFREGHNFGATFKDGNRRTSWEKLTATEQTDLVRAMHSMYLLFSMAIREEEK